MSRAMGLTKRWSEPPVRLPVRASDSGWREFLLAVAQLLSVRPHCAYVLVDTHSC
jgi:hypothetical protein